MPRYQSNSLMLKILETLERATLPVADILDSITTSGFVYKTWRTKESYTALKKRQRERRRTLEQEHNERRERQRVHTLLARLEKQGLVKKVKRNKGNRLYFTLTDAGREKKVSFAEKIKKALIEKWRNDISVSYETKPSKNYTLVIFDIPEKEKRKRIWLRDILRRMGFRKLQKSVWVAQVKLPEVFIHDLKKINILECVIICSVVAKGTIEDYVERVRMRQ